MTTPAEELLTAAATLKRLAGQATEPPWSTNWNAQEYELVAPSRPYPIAQWTYAIATQGPKVAEQRAECDTSDADYMAAMGPNVGALLAAWLEFQAAMDGRLLALVDGAPEMDEATWGGKPHPALVIARAVNAATRAEETQ